jgi:asparaginyl-tRNA synthetase
MITQEELKQRERLIAVRGELLKGARDFFYDKQWPEVTTSLLTSMTGSCENVEHLFRLPYFNAEAHLSQTSQLQLEHLIITTGKPAWTITHSFRAEKEVDDRHLTEFILIEPEVFGYDLDQIITLQQDLIHNLADRLAERLPELIDIDAVKGLIYPFKRITYTEAIATLSSLGIHINHGDDISSEYEKALLKWNNNQPLFLTHFPKSLKFFNMKWSGKDDLTESADLLMPPFGEVTGSAAREETLPNLKRNIESSAMFEHLKDIGATLSDFDWYFSLWPDDETAYKRAGFGLGFERLVGFFLGESDIRKCIEFPRNRERLAP